MCADFLELAVNSRFSNSTLFDVDNEPVVRPQEAQIQTLPGLVPLSADHNAVAITERLGAGENRRHQVRIKPTDALEQVAHLFAFELQLCPVSQVLVLTSAAFAEIRTRRFDPLWGGLDDSQQ